MEKQRTSLPYPRIIRQTLKQGLKGYWAGFWPWGFVLGMTKGSVLGGARAVLLDLCENKLGMDQKRADVISGFGAGAVQGVFMSPILLARTRVNQSLTERAAQAAAQGKKLETGLLTEMRMSSVVLNDAIRQEGIGMLATGLPTMVMKRTLDWGTRYLIIGKYKDYFRERKGGAKLNDMETLAASFLGGATSCAITMPVDRMMPVLQAAGASGEGIVPFLKKKIAAEGVGTLQRGFFMRAVHTGYHTMFAIFVADKIYTALS
eukprot:TRINITY_DN54798_c0_g1_i1.p2 TRINITY_DN54798_c0_g1~~TRINITY_DN54798_c0_g1_i1.p2  ORF type:complete len:262 (+),score=130.03 TRINITY_DN54798_c0_g1_i1:286-1071(+)